ncbi:hypothetical protein F8154_13430 [Alkaliphilus pronyensis]|uniref:Uncharacterized protein n=1 Tax=Alkaliphilus pronyensis TaxID=1482732 RepID=A0A6I0EWZ3_9FIRM|nr:hypothetical protein [Alkaliphilus pronyensis]KAB3530917.1 hypothetical protein F8154_13430 [Alkaliphilus pronyensis]
MVKAKYLIIVMAVIIALLVILQYNQYNENTELKKEIGRIHYDNIHYVKVHVISEIEELLNESYNIEKYLCMNQWKFNEFITFGLPAGFFDIYFSSIKHDYQLLTQELEANNEDNIDAIKQRLIAKLIVIEDELELIQNHCGEDLTKYYELTQDSELIRKVEARMQKELIKIKSQ